MWGQVRAPEKKFWCDCPLGPSPMPLAVEPQRVLEMVAGRRWDVDPVISSSEPGGVDESTLELKDYARITYTFWKPIEVPIDLTMEIPAK